MTLNGVMAVTLRYFAEVGKPALQKTICSGIYAFCCISMHFYCIFSACTMSSKRKFTFAISSPDEFLVLYCIVQEMPCGTVVHYRTVWCESLLYVGNVYYTLFTCTKLFTTSQRPATSARRLYKKSIPSRLFLHADYVPRSTMSSRTEVAIGSLSRPRASYGL